MRCYYEVFELSLTATADEIRKQYKKLALRHHPDKNVGQEEIATEKFKEITAAYGVLNDPQEKKWYDDHRDSILRGGDGTADSNEGGDHIINLWPFFSPGCYGGPSEGSKGFYTVFSGLFRQLQESEVRERDLGESGSDSAPMFGGPSASSSEVFAFYNYWSNFVTKMSFSWEDKYNPADAPNRQVRRAIEKENKKYRDAGRTKYAQTVRALANHLRKLDDRVKIFEDEIQRKRLEEENKRHKMKADKVSKRKEARDAFREQLDADEGEQERRRQEREGAFLLADNSDLSDYDEAEEDEEDLDKRLGGSGKVSGKLNGDAGVDASIDDDAAVAAAAGVVEGEEDESDDEEEEEEEEEVLFCEVCKKSFKSDAQLSQHLASKVHRKKAQELEKKTKKSGGGNGPSGKSSMKTSGKVTAGSQRSSKVSKEPEESEESSDEDEEDVVEEPTVFRAINELAKSAKGKTKIASSSKGSAVNKEVATGKSSTGGGNSSNKVAEDTSDSDSNDSDSDSEDDLRLLSSRHHRPSKDANTGDNSKGKASETTSSIQDKLASDGNNVNSGDADDSDSDNDSDSDSDEEDLRAQLLKLSLSKGKKKSDDVGGEVKEKKTSKAKAKEVTTEVKKSEKAEEAPVEKGKGSKKASSVSGSSSSKKEFTVRGKKAVVAGDEEGGDNNEVQEGGGGEFVCQDCGWRGPSRNQLFQHLTSSGHQTAFDVQGALPSSMTGRKTDGQTQTQAQSEETASSSKKSAKKKNVQKLF